jgi:hypothetical protein
MKIIVHIIDKKKKIIHDCVEKKLSLSKLQAQIWQKSSDRQEEITLSDLDLDGDIFKNLIDKDTSTDNTYKMKK